MKRMVALLAGLMLLGPLCWGQESPEQLKINKKNLVIKEWNTSARGNRTLDHLTTYSPEGKKIEEIEYDSYGRQKWRKRFEWGDNDKVARELVYDEHNKLVNYKKFDYNEFNRKKVQYTYDPKGRLVGTKVYEYITQDSF